MPSTSGILTNALSNISFPTGFSIVTDRIDNSSLLKSFLFVSSGKFVSFGQNLLTSVLSNSFSSMSIHREIC